MKVTLPSLRGPSWLAAVCPTRLVPAGLALGALLLAGGQPAQAAITIKVTNSVAGSFTWVCPAGVTAVQVECWGGGGGGGGTVSGLGNCGGGGAGGAYARTNAYAVTAGTTYYLQVGAAGAGGAVNTSPGGAGGDTWFSNATPAVVVLAKGGGAGGGGAAGVGGTNGPCPAGSIGGSAIYLGGNGAAGVFGTGSGAGGSSAGTGSVGNPGISTNAGAAPIGGGPGAVGYNSANIGRSPLSGPGGGGSGGFSGGAATKTGGAGYAGQVILTYTISFNTLSWIGDGTNNRWSTNAGNTVWDSDANGTADLGFTEGDVVTFGLAGSNNPTVNLGSQVAPLSITVNSASNYTFTGSGWIGGATSLVKSNTGSLTITTTNSYAGATTVAAGALTLASGGSISNASPIYVADGAANAILTINGGTVYSTGGINPEIPVGKSTGAGVIILNSGTVNVTGQAFFGNGGNSGSFGALLMNGGTWTNSTYLSLGRGQNSTTGNQVGELVMTGGSLGIGAGGLEIGSFVTGPNTLSLAQITGGTLFLTPYIAVGKAGSGILNISGTASVTTVSKNGVIIANTGGGSGILNLLTGGVLTTPVVTNAATTGSSLLNFNGGTLQAGAGTTSFINVVNGAYVFGGGGTLNNGGFAITNAQPLLAPAGSGVTSISSFTGGAGYLAPPIIQVTNGVGDTTGAGASVIAQIDSGTGSPTYGQVTNIVITSPGVNYTATPTFLVNGGGATTPATITGAAPAANTGGGMTFSGAGLTTLSGVSTYTGNTVISNGTLALTGSGSISSSPNIAINPGASLSVAGYTLGSQTLHSGDGVGGAGTVNGNLNLGSGALALTYTNGAPSLHVAGGTLNFSGNAVTVTVAGTALSVGSYLLVDTNASGLVAGTLPASVTVNGAGAATGTVKWLELQNSQLYLKVDHAPVAQPMTVSRAAGLRVLIALSDVATNWSDADSDAVSLVSLNLTSTNGVTVTTNSDYILYPAAAANVNDQLSYVITDPLGATVTGYINLVVAGSVTGTNSIANITLGATNSVKAYGIPGKTYILERSTNLVDWVDVHTNTASAVNGEIDAMDDFSDLGGTPPAEAFYRLKWQP